MLGFSPRFIRKGPDQYWWLYKYLSRRVWWAETEQRLKDYSMLVSLLFALVTGIGLLIAWVTESELLVMIIGGVAGGLFVIIDIASIFFGVFSVRSHDGHLDLLRITNVPPEDYVAAQHRLAQVQTWRLLVVMQAMRLVIVLGFLTVGLPMTLFMVMLTVGAGLIWLVSLIILALSEPIWRLETMTAIGIYAGARWPGGLAAYGMALVMMFGVWIVQGLVGWVPILLTREWGDDTILLALLALCLPIMTAIIWWGQRTLRDMCLRAASQHMFYPVD